MRDDTGQGTYQFIQEYEQTDAGDLNALGRTSYDKLCHTLGLKTRPTTGTTTKDRQCVLSGRLGNDDAGVCLTTDLVKAAFEFGLGL